MEVDEVTKIAKDRVDLAKALIRASEKSEKPKSAGKTNPNAKSIADAPAKGILSLTFV